MSAGSWEDWRADADTFPVAALGRPLDGWPGERWLDVRSPTVLDLMRERLAVLAAKGCRAVEFDNVDGYANAIFKMGIPVSGKNLFPRGVLTLSRNVWRPVVRFRLA